jgi:hypothetical protein
MDLPKRHVLAAARLTFMTAKAFLCNALFQALSMAYAGTPVPPTFKKPSAILKYLITFGLPSLEEWSDLTDFTAIAISWSVPWFLLIIIVMRGQLAHWRLLTPSRQAFGYAIDGLDFVLKVMIMMGPVLIPSINAGLMPVAIWLPIAFLPIPFNMKLWSYFVVFLSLLNTCLVVWFALRFARVDNQPEWLATNGRGLLFASRDRKPVDLDRLAKRRHALASASPSHDVNKFLLQMGLAINLVLICPFSQAAAAVIRIVLGLFLFANAVRHEAFYRTDLGVVAPLIGVVVDPNKVNTAAAAGTLMAYVASAAAVPAQQYAMLDSWWLVLLNLLTVPTTAAFYYLHRPLHEFLKRRLGIAGQPPAVRDGDTQWLLGA